MRSRQFPFPSMETDRRKSLCIDESRGVRRQPRLVRIDAALGGQKYGICPPSAASMRTNRGRRLTPRNSSIAPRDQNYVLSGVNAVEDARKGSY